MRIHIYCNAHPVSWARALSMVSKCVHSCVSSLATRRTEEWYAAGSSNGGRPSNTGGGGATAPDAWYAAGSSIGGGLPDTVGGGATAPDTDGGLRAAAGSSTGKGPSACPDIGGGRAVDTGGGGRRRHSAARPGKSEGKSAACFLRRRDTMKG